jgi:hypothetical protein
MKLLLAVVVPREQRVEQETTEAIAHLMAEPQSVEVAVEVLQVILMPLVG